MKRDKELQRLLLLLVRDGREPAELSKYPEADRIFNSVQLINNGLVDGEVVRGEDGEYLSAEMRHLTSTGYDVLAEPPPKPKTDESDRLKKAVEEATAQKPGNGVHQRKAIKTPTPFEEENESVRIGSRVNFSRLASSDEATLGVDNYANVLTKLFRGADDKDFCFGIFGPWGRGKTYLVDRMVQKLRETQPESGPDYQIVRFSALKFPSRPEAWVSLYETFYNNMTSAGSFRSAAYTMLAGIYRHGVARLWMVWLALMLVFMPKYWLFGPFNSWGNEELLVGAAAAIYGAVFASKFWRSPGRLRRRYLGGGRGTDKPGLESTVGRDLKALLNGWVQVHLKRARIRRGLLLLWTATLALVGFVVWRNYRNAPLAIFLGVAAVLPTIVVSLAFKRAALSPWRLLLVVDDLDRCQSEHLLAVMESINLLLEDEEIRKRMQVMMLVNEDILKHAIWDKFKNLAYPIIQKEVGTTYEAKKIVRENFEKMFTAHLRLGPLTATDVMNVVFNFGERVDPKRLDFELPVSHDEKAASDYSPTTHEADENYTITPREKQIILTAILESSAGGRTELGPRAVRAIMFRYQLARLLLEELGQHDWNPARLARKIVKRQSSALISTNGHGEDGEAILSRVAEQVA